MLIRAADTFLLFFFFFYGRYLEFSILFISQMLQRSSHTVLTLKSLEALSISMLQKCMFLNVADEDSLQAFCMGLFFP